MALRYACGCVGWLSLLDMCQPATYGHLDSVKPELARGEVNPPVVISTPS